MPSVKNFKDKNHKKAKSANEGEAASTDATRAKRRPGREEVELSEAEVKVVDVESGIQPDHVETQAQSEESGAQAEPQAAQEMPPPQFEAQEEAPRIEIKFTGSELVRSKFPLPFDLAEVVATDWVHGGNFDKLPISHPLAQYVAKTGLLKAKEIEKKVLESPVTEKVAMQVLTVGMKAQSVVEQIKSKVIKK